MGNLPPGVLVRPPLNSSLFRARRRQRLRRGVAAFAIVRVEHAMPVLQSPSPKCYVRESSHLLNLLMMALGHKFLR